MASSIAGDSMMRVKLDRAIYMRNIDDLRQKERLKSKRKKLRKKSK